MRHFVRAEHQRAANPGNDVVIPSPSASARAQAVQCASGIAPAVHGAAHSPACVARAIAALLALGASHAHAQIEELTLNWDAPAQCPDAAAVRARIERHLPAGHRATRALVADARVARDGARHRMELELHGDGTPARRTLENESCAALADVAALLVALALDPASAELPPPAADPTDGSDARADARPPAAAETKPASEAPRAQPATDRRRRTSTPATAAADRAPPSARDAVPATGAAAAGEPSDDDDRDDDGAGPAFGFELGAALRLAAGMLPQTPAFGLAPQLGLRVGRVRARAALTFWLQARSAAERYPRAALDARGLAGDGALCFELWRAPIAFAPCAGVEIGQHVLETDGISAPATSTATWAAAGAGVHAGYGLIGGLHATLEALALAPFTRPRWFVQTAQGDVELFVSARVTLRISLGITYVFE